MEQLEDEYAIGLDLGTTFSCIGVYRNGWVEIIPNKNGEKITPSVVIISNDDKILVGEDTTDFLVKNYDSCIYEVKRLIGREIDEEELKQLQERLSFKIIKPHKKTLDKKGNFPEIEITNNGKTKTYTPVEISSAIIKKMVFNAEKYLNKKITKLVITVPANFSDSQRLLTRQAAEALQLKVLRIINEPTAAALAYGFDEKKNQDSNILVFDLGGGTFDVSLVNINNNEKFEVKCTSGDTHLGGEDFDNKLVNYCLTQFCNKHNCTEDDMRKNNPKGLKRLKIACEKSKRLLSISEEIPIYVDNFYIDETLYIVVTKAKFEDLCKDLFAKLTKPIDDILHQSKLGISDIKEVVMVGGSTRIPKIKEIITSFFESVKINDTINPDEAVAYGAAVDAYKIHSKKKAVLNDIILLDTTPFSLGLGVENYYQLIIPRGSTIPTTVTNLGITDINFQNSVELPIYEGEYNDISKNHFLGKFEITDIPEKMAGEVVFDVTYSVDIEGGVWRV